MNYFFYSLMVLQSDILDFQDFEPKNNHYDVVWIQWVIGHLADGMLLHYSIEYTHFVDQQTNVTVFIDLSYNRQSYHVADILKFLRGK